MKEFRLRKEVEEVILRAKKFWIQGDNKKANEILHKELLNAKAKFPLLEYGADLLFQDRKFQETVVFLNDLLKKETIGGFVLAGKGLQNFTEAHHRKSLEAAKRFIAPISEWYGCDIVGERVMGYALWKLPEETLPELKKYLSDENPWIRRVVGVAGHYAVKKGLKRKYVEELFSLLMTQAHVTDFHTKTGTGWAAKTIAKFHPDIVHKYEEKILGDPNIRPWFKTKIRIGFGRSAKYAGRYTE